MEKKNLIVQLFVPTADNRGRIGTAYPVAKNVLLTAAHVIGDADGQAIQARWWHQSDSDREWTNCSQIIWDGREQSPKTDVVLLGCKFPISVHLKWGAVTAARPDDRSEWSSEGFPFVGEKGSKPVPLRGLTHSMGDRAEHFHLSIIAGAETEEGWRGASGSPVFVNDCIIGVIVNSPQNFNAQRFEAVPLFRLLAHEAFRKLVGYSEHEDQNRLRHLTPGALHALLKAADGGSGFYFEPETMSPALKKIVRQCQIPTDTSVLGIIDCRGWFFWLPTDTYVVFTDKGVYFTHRGKRNGFLPYAAFANADFQWKADVVPTQGGALEWYEINLGETLIMGSASSDRMKTLLRMLRVIRVSVMKSLPSFDE